jgi:tRNA modification GTPase
MGIIRLSGPDAIRIVNLMARTKETENLEIVRGFSRVEGQIVLDADLSAPAIFHVFRAPRSYTRQDMVEILTVGSPPLLEWARENAARLGAVPAEPGEFTARAFLAGAMDLSAAESVAGLIRAQSDTQLRAARRMADGTLARRIHEIREALADLTALIEADIDFAEEPIEFITPLLLHERLKAIESQLGRLLDNAESSERFDTLPRILLFGRPNVGKSTLMNRLSGTHRAICAAVAGTTRDLLAAPIRLGRGEAILLDAAGIDESPDRIIAAARAMTLRAAERVDLVCMVLDVSDVEDESLWSQAATLDIPRTVSALNKCDLLTHAQRQRAVERLRARGTAPVCPVSALDGSGVEDLRVQLHHALSESIHTMMGEAVMLSGRQRQAMDESLSAIRRAEVLTHSAKATIDCAELLAFELREALEILGTVTGEVTTEDLLGRIFSSFCIGK